MRTGRNKNVRWHIIVMATFLASVSLCLIAMLKLGFVSASMLFFSMIFPFYVVGLIHKSKHYSNQKDSPADYFLARVGIVLVMLLIGFFIELSIR